MTINEYQTLAMKTLNPELSPRDVLINGVMGLCGEAGEAIDIVKKHLMQGHELDRDKLIKELGDVAWYLAETATALDADLEDVLSRNIEKLKKRYPNGTDKRSAENDDGEKKNWGWRTACAPPQFSPSFWLGCACLGGAKRRHLYI